MKKFRPVLIALIALLFYTVTDILIWQRAFEANDLTHLAPTYHTGWLVSLAGYATIGLLLMWGHWKDCLYYLTALLISAFSGLEDVLYYVLDGKSMPSELPWLDPNPMIYQATRDGVVGSVVFWMVMLALLYFAMYVWRIEPLQIQEVSPIE